MLPTGLFVDSPEEQDASMHPLTNNIEGWPEDIITKLKERVPEVSGMNMIVKFMKKDEESGTATGSILISNGKKSAVVPIIIKDFAMYPLDVFLCDNKLLPLTPDFFKSLFTDGAIFQKIEEYPNYGGMGRFEDGNLWNVTYPPSLGRYAYASANYATLSEINIDGSILKQALQKDTQSALRFHKNGHAEMINKVANSKPVNMNEFSQGKDNLIQRNIVMLRKDGNNKYNLLSTGDKVFEPQISVHNREGCMPFIARISGKVSDAMNEVDQNGEKIIHIDNHIPDDKIYIEGAKDVKVEPITEYGAFSVKKKTGVEVIGFGIPNVINFDMEKVNLKAFIGNTMSTIQTDIAGVRLTNNNFKFPFSEPMIGQTGCFVYLHEMKNALCTVPVTISSVEEQFGNYEIMAYDLSGIKLHLRLGSGMVELERIAKIDGVYLIPKKMKWVAMEGFEEISNSPIDYAVKTAGENKTGNPIKIIKMSSEVFAVKGADKYASAAGWDKNYLTDVQARFLLASLGASQEKIATVMKIASDKTFAVVHGLNRPLTMEEKVASRKPLVEKLNKLAGSFKSNLIKEASYMENAQTVDSLLALNFVSPENMQKFIGKIPSFKSAISNLASCLIASRVGVKEIPEQATASAMTRLIEVVNGLEALRATQQDAP